MSVFGKNNYTFNFFPTSFAEIILHLRSFSLIIDIDLAAENLIVSWMDYSYPCMRYFYTKQK